MARGVVARGLRAGTRPTEAEVGDSRERFRMETEAETKAGT